MRLFTKGRLKKYMNIDEYWNNELKDFVKKYKAKAALYKGVAFFENYIPLYRVSDDKDFFTFAEPNTVYAWNINDLSPERYYRVVNEAKKRFDDLKGKKIATTPDPGGF